MLGPERGLDNTRSHGRDSDPKLLVEVGERSHEAANGVFRGAVNRSCEDRILACNAGDMVEEESYQLLSQKGWGLSQP